MLFLYIPTVNLRKTSQFGHKIQFLGLSVKRQGFCFFNVVTNLYAFVKFGEPHQIMEHNPLNFCIF